MQKRKVSEKSLDNLKLGRLPMGEKPLKSSPVSVKLPEELDEYVRSKPNRNQWLIEAVRAAIEKELQST